MILLISQQYPRLSKGRKRLADYILNHYDQAVFMTAAQLGAAAGVSESTAVRFAEQLGCEGYPEFQKKLEQTVQNKLNDVKRMQKVYEGLDQPQMLKYILQTDMNRIAGTLETVSGAAFEEALRILDKSRKIYVIGVRESAPLAMYLYQNLRKIYEDVFLPGTSSDHELLEQLIYLRPEDTVIGISFPRYSMRTLKALEFASSRQAAVITLTDTVHSPLNLYSSCNLIAQTDMASVANSMAAPMSVVNAMVTALAMNHQEQVNRYMQQVDAAMEDYGVNGTDEMDVWEGSVRLRL